MILILRREAPTVNLASRFGTDSQPLPAYKTNEKQGFFPGSENYPAKSVFIFDSGGF